MSIKNKPGYKYPGFIIISTSNLYQSINANIWFF